MIAKMLSSILYDFTRIGMCSFQVKTGLVSLSQLILGANSLVQAALPAMLRDTPKEYYAGIMRHIQVPSSVAWLCL